MMAKHRGCTPDLLRKAIRGDLDWIVMKSLEKDRARRYETASGLAEDIRRHLEHEPVLAHGPGAAYRLRKFLRRHRSQVLSASSDGRHRGCGGCHPVHVESGPAPTGGGRRLQAPGHSVPSPGAVCQGRPRSRPGDDPTHLRSRYVGPEARLLCAGILVDNRRSDEAMAMLGGLLNERAEIAGAAHALLARILWERRIAGCREAQEIEEHRRQAEALLPETAEAYFLRAMTPSRSRSSLLHSTRPWSLILSIMSPAGCGPSRTMPPASTTGCGMMRWP